MNKYKSHAYICIGVHLSVHIFSHTFTVKPV